MEGGCNAGTSSGDSRRCDMRRCLAAVLGLAGCPSMAAAQPTLTIERLLGDGWDIAGYVGTADNRSTVMLFRHKDRKYLVQCSVLYDVTRAQRTLVNCYELH
jgi:hypothetical protein